jgi:TPR repeat protein
VALVPWARTAGGPLSASCPASAATACEGATADECTERALSEWGDAHDDRAIGCVARMLSEACSQGDARACGFAGRLWLEGRGVARDVQTGLTLLTRACDDGLVIGCSAGAQWLAKEGDETGKQASAQSVPADQKAALRVRFELEQSCLLGQSDACYQVGEFFGAGLDGFPRDLARAAQEYSRGCNFEDARACNSVGCALEYGDGIARDPARAKASFERACHLGESTGCANVGYMAEHGEGTARDVPLARGLYRDACRAGEFYGCVHAELLDAEDAGAPRDFAGALAHWRRACDGARSRRACEFVSILYLDGSDGALRDAGKSLEAMSRACSLGDLRACVWVKAYREE